MQFAVGLCIIKGGSAKIIRNVSGVMRKCDIDSVKCNLLRGANV